MEVEKAKVETKLKKKTIAKKGAYGGYVVSIRKLLNRKLEDEEVEKIKNSINKKFKGRICTFEYYNSVDSDLRNINVEEYNKLKQSMSVGEVGYIYCNATFKIKKVTNNYIVFDIVEVDDKLHLVKYKCLRSKYLKRFTYDEFIDMIVKEFKVTREEAEKRTILDCIKHRTAYFLDREPDAVMRSFRESLEIAEIEFDISEFLKTNEEEDNEIKEIMNEISKLVEKYSEEKVKKAFKILFNL